MLLCGCSGNPSGSPERIAAIALPHADAIQDMTVWGDTALLALRENPGPELVAVDVADPSHPRVAWTFEVGADVNAIDVPMSGDVALLATSRDDAELIRFDLANRRIAGVFDAPGAADGVYVHYARFASDRAWLCTADNPDGAEAYSLDLHDPDQPAVLGTNEATAPLAKPPPPDPRERGYDAGGDVMARGRGAVDPTLTLLAVRSPTAALQVVSHLNDRTTIPDTNGDGVRLVACLGDSNTLVLMNKNPGSWCQYLAQHVWTPRTWFVDWAWMGATMTPPHAPVLEQQLREIEKWRADLVIAAFGTNDVTHHEPAEIATSAEQLTIELTHLGLPFLIATPPPRVDVPALAARVDELAALIRRAYPGDRIVDFRAGMDASDLAGDGFHVSAKGAVTQGRIAAAKLLLP